MLSGKRFFCETHYCRNCFNPCKLIDFGGALYLFPSVNMVTVTDLDDLYDQHCNFNRVQDLKAALANSVALES